jgi:hypothetical protein
MLCVAVQREIAGGRAWKRRSAARVERQLLEVVDCRAVTFDGLAHSLRHRNLEIAGGTSGRTEIGLPRECSGVAGLGGDET